MTRAVFDAVRHELQSGRAVNATRQACSSSENFHRLGKLSKAQEAFKGSGKLARNGLKHMRVQYVLSDTVDVLSDTANVA